MFAVSCSHVTKQFSDWAQKEASESIAWERWEGTIEYTLMAPIKRLTYLTGTSASTIVYGLARTIIVLLIIAQFFELHLENTNIVTASLILAIREESNCRQSAGR